MHCSIYAPHYYGRRQYKYQSVYAPTTHYTVPPPIYPPTPIKKPTPPTYERLLLSDSQRLQYGFPIEMGLQTYIQPNGFQETELFYTEQNTSRVCCRCRSVFYVERDGFQPISPHTVCRDSAGTSYNFHIHTQLPIEHLNNFKKAPKVDETNKKMSGKLFALDVESVYTSHGQAVGRVTVVDKDENTVIDEVVLPKHPVYDYVTKYSGLTSEDFKSATETLESVREKILSIINEESILVGHALNGDLKALGILHSNVIDTSVLFMKNGRRPSLRHLSSEYLKMEIQKNGHCSKEDAIAALGLVYFASLFKLSCSQR